MKPISVIVIGAGGRGTKYATIMKDQPEKFQVVGVAERLQSRRKNMQQLFDLPDEACFDSWEKILEQPKMADLAVIATMDDMHYGPAMKAIELGYHILLEKPVAQTAQECADIALAAKNKGVQVLVCHVLRYSPFYKRVKKLLMDGVIGKVISCIAVEAVGDIHYSHSYIRGDWHSEKETTPMLLAKSCHDLDIIQWLLNKPCTKVQSFGDRTYFRSENAPEGAPVRCLEGNCPVEETCPYSCKKLYLREEGNKYYRWFRRAAAKEISKEFYPNDEEVLQAMRVNDYGLCVFHANNDIVDHQVVNMEFEGGITASFTMNSFNEGGRYIRLFGTKGELFAYAADKEITVYNFLDGQKHKYSVMETEESILGGHGGGDEGIVSELYEYLSDSYDGYCAATIDTSVKNHLIGFAAERARHEGSVVSMDDYMKEFGMENAYEKH